jgi:hypothetical protein
MAARSGGASFSTISPVVVWRAAARDQQERRKQRSPTVDTRKYAGPTFIGLGDVNGGALREQIAVVNTGKYDKLNVVFESGDILSLNATNVKILQKAYGVDSDLWIGKDVELYGGEVEYQKKMQPSVLIRPISPPLPSEAKKAAIEKFDGDKDFDDEIPY